MPKSLSPLAIFRNRAFTLLWSGQLVSTVGSALSSLAASILVFRLTGSAISVGLMLMATAAPSLLVGLLAGALVDRFDRRRIMIAADLLRAVLALAISIVALSGFLNAPAFIARRLVVQRHAPREMRGRVSSAFSVSRDVLFLVGMALAGLADVIDVRLLYLLSALMILVAGVWVLVLPGLRQPAAEWRRAMGLLLKAPHAPGLGAGRAATLADLDALAVLLPMLAALPAKERAGLVGQSSVVQAPPGACLLRRGETGDAAYFILSGRAVAGLPQPDGSYNALSTLQPGDFFGEIAALTGARRTADVAAEDTTTLFQVPAPALRALMANPALSQLVLTKMTERLSRTSLSELPRFAGLDQEALKELRMKEEV